MTESVQEAVGTLSACATVLAGICLNDPVKEEGRSQIKGLAAIDLPKEWPYGSRVDLMNAQRLIVEGASDIPTLRAEWVRQFVGPGHFEAPQWASVYLDSDEVVFGCAHLELNEWMRKHGISPLSSTSSREPVDSFGKELALLGWLAEHQIDAVKEFMASHLLPWSFRYLRLLGETSHQPFWQGYSLLCSTTLSHAAEALDVSVVKRKLYH